MYFRFARDKSFAAESVYIYRCTSALTQSNSKIKSAQYKRIKSIIFHFVFVKREKKFLFCNKFKNIITLKSNNR